MSKRLLNLCLTALLSVVSTAAWALSEVNGVYQIGTAEDLKAFAQLVNDGNVNASAVLTADIDKGIDATMIGSAAYDYQGVFDGQGHTITINTYSGNENGSALFRNVGALAIIQNLKVQGTITTDKSYAAGIAVWSRGTARNCYVDVTVQSAKVGDGTHGGVFAVAYPGALVENTLAKFVIKGVATQNCGGIVGWVDGVGVNITNCLVISDGSNFDITNACGTLGRHDGCLRTVDLESYLEDPYENRPSGASTNNYATNKWGTDNENCVTIVSAEDLKDGRICYQLNTDQSSINWAQEIGVDDFPVPAIFGGKQVYASGATDCDGKSEADLTFSNSGSVQATTHTYDKFGICTVCGKYNTKALTRDAATGYFLISTAADFDLAEGLNRLHDGGYFGMRLTNDIEYKAEPGHHIFNASNIFHGSVDGEGHAITIEMSEMGDRASLLPRVHGGTIENIIMHGTISTNGRYAGSITSDTQNDNCVIRNIFSDITINTNYDGDNTTAGLVGVANSKVMMENVIYAGDINGLEGGATECLAGLVGWSAGQVTIRNSAFIGTLNYANGDSKTISRNPGNITCINVYTINEYGDGSDASKYTVIENHNDVESGALAFALNSSETGL